MCLYLRSVSFVSIVIAFDLILVAVERTKREVAATSAAFPVNDTTIYRMVMKETRCGAVFPGSEWSTPTIRADFIGFALKSVEVSAYLPARLVALPAFTINGLHGG
jgi:hypothetical protein